MENHRSLIAYIRHRVFARSIPSLGIYSVVIHMHAQNSRGQSPQGVVTPIDAIVRGSQSGHKDSADYACRSHGHNGSRVWSQGVTT